MKKIVISFLFIMLLSASAFSCSAVQTSNTTIYVDDDGGADYTSIQDAIDAAGDGDTIFVYSGSYHGISINKPLTLEGENMVSTIIDAHGGSIAVRIPSENVQIQGFTITNATRFPSSGIYVTAGNVLITKNTFKNNYWAINIHIQIDDENIRITKNNFYDPVETSLLGNSFQQKSFRSFISNLQSFNKDAVLYDANHWSFYLGLAPKIADIGSIFLFIPWVLMDWNATTEPYHF